MRSLGVEHGLYIRDPKKPGHCYQVEVKLKGHRALTATFDRKSDAKAWIQKTEADIRAGRHHLYSEGRKHVFWPDPQKLVHSRLEVRDKLSNPKDTNYEK